MILDPVDGRCDVGSDPRLTDEERARIAGPQYTGLPYVMPRADGSHLTAPERRDQPQGDPHA